MRERGGGSFFRSFIIGYLIGHILIRHWKAILVIILVIAIALGISYVTYTLKTNPDEILKVLERDVFPYLIPMVICPLLGALFGLIPFILGKYFKMDYLGNKGLRWCILGGFLTPLIPFFIDGKNGLRWSFLGLFLFPALLLLSASFSVIIYLRSNGTPEKAKVEIVSQTNGPVSASESCSNDRIISPPTNSAYPAVRCLSGPYYGRIYEITKSGISMGRSPDCTIVYPAGNTHVSRHHCFIHRYQGMIVLTDMGSTNGTFTEDGRRFQPRVPVYVNIGMKIFLGDRENAFEIFLMQ